MVMLLYLWHRYETCLTWVQDVAWGRCVEGGLYYVNYWVSLPI